MTHNAITSAIVFWDNDTDRWGYRLYIGDALVDFGEVDVDPDSPIQDAVEELKRWKELPEDAEFALVRDEGGSAIWAA
jgi:hypothetical protein